MGGTLCGLADSPADICDIPAASITANARPIETVYAALYDPPWDYFEPHGK